MLQPPLTYRSFWQLLLGPGAFGFAVISSGYFEPNVVSLRGDVCPSISESRRSSRHWLSARACF